MNPAEKFQKAVAEAVQEAAGSNVHPATVYTVLCMTAEDVSQAIRRSAQMAQMNATPTAKDKADRETAETIFKPDEKPNN